MNFLYSLLLIWVFISKKRLIKIQTKHFLELVFINFVSLIVEFISRQLDHYTLIEIFTHKFYLFLLFLWLIKICNYAFSITNSRDNESMEDYYSRNKNLLYINRFIIILNLILVIILPVDIGNPSGLHILQGVYSKVLIFQCFLNFFFWFFKVLELKKKILEYKYLHVFIKIIMTIGCSFLQLLDRKSVV